MSNADKIIDGLVASSDVSKELNHPGPDIKPCIAQMLKNSYSRADFPNRNAVSHIIASDLRRIGCSQEEVTERIVTWNKGNLAHLRYSEIAKAVRSAFRKEYKYGCDHEFLKPTCIGRDVCPFFTRVLSKRKYINNRPFIWYRWPEILSNVPKLIYSIALVELERTRQVGPGGLIFASHYEIAKLAGVTRKMVKSGLEELREYGLIEYIPGIPRKWKRIASEIRRIIPIPKPSSKLLGKLHE